MTAASPPTAAQQEGLGRSWAWHVLKPLLVVVSGLARAGPLRAGWGLGGAGAALQLLLASVSLCALWALALGPAQRVVSTQGNPASPGSAASALPSSSRLGLTGPPHVALPGCLPDLEGARLPQAWLAGAQLCPPPPRGPPGLVYLLSDRWPWRCCGRCGHRLVSWGPCRGCGKLGRMAEPVLRAQRWGPPRGGCASTPPPPAEAPGQGTGESLLLGRLPLGARVRPGPRGQ